eukprot:756512-Hanusia_phi.AAC.1
MMVAAPGPVNCSPEAHTPGAVRHRPRRSKAWAGNHGMAKHTDDHRNRSNRTPALNLKGHKETVIRNPNSAKAALRLRDMMCICATRPGRYDPYDSERACRLKMCTKIWYGNFYFN